MARHGRVRARPDELVPGTLRVVSVGLDYGRRDDGEAWATLADGESAYVARYALGRDYHKLMRQRLQRLADRIAETVGPFGHRVFVDSAPVLERALARNAGLGWIGKHTCLIDKRRRHLVLPRRDLPRPAAADRRAGERALRHLHALHRHLPDAGDRRANRLDARRCISYLTIEHEGAIPEELRPLIGDRIFGCDDCQLVCPWNKFAKRSDEPDFRARNELDRASWRSCSRGTRTSSCAAPKAPRSAAVGTNAGCATSRSRWAMRRRRRRC